MKISPHKLSEIASLLRAEFIGDPAHLITGLNEVHRVENGDLMFVDHPKYYEKALNSAATTILINRQVDCPAGKALIFSDDPFRDFNKLIAHFQPENFSLKPIADDAKIGAGTKLFPGVYVGRNVTIGKNCVIMPNVVIHDNTIIGNDVRIQSNVVLGSEAFYYKRRDDHFDRLLTCGRVIINDRVEIGAACTIDRGVTADTIIGEGTILDNMIHVGHDTTIGKMCQVAAATFIAGAVTIEDNVVIWGHCVFVAGITIGKGATILGGSGVSKDLEGGKTYFGAPAEEARTKWKEMALIRRLPELFGK